jgi:hypothetical protein
MRATCSGSARSPRAARLASSATQRASAASTPPGLTKGTSYTAAARGIRAPTGPLVPRCVLPPDTHPVHPRLGQGRALGIPISGPHAVNLVNRWWQFHDTQLSSWVDAAFRPWPSTRSAARSGRPRGPATHGPTSTSNRCGSQACTATSAVAIPTPALAEIALLWMADRARECGLVLQADAFPASPENATQAPQDRMALCRSQPAGNAAPIPHGLLPPASATDPAARREGPRPRVRRRHRRRPAPSRPAVRTRRVDRISRCRRSGSPGRAGPAPGNTSATAARRERDRVNKPALVRSETSIGGVR